MRLVKHNLKTIEVLFLWLWLAQSRRGGRRRRRNGRPMRGRSSLSSWRRRVIVRKGTVASFVPREQREAFVECVEDLGHGGAEVVELSHGVLVQDNAADGEGGDAGLDVGLVRV